MAVEERDEHTGYLTTGHEWNGIKELNTPVPRPVYFFLIVTFLFGLVYWVLMPSWPLGRTYYEGTLGVDQKLDVKRSLERAQRQRSAWTSRILAEDYPAILADQNLMTAVRDTGRTLFGDNCAACHGSTAQGAKGYPNLTTPSWLWGGEPEQIAETIRVGINSAHPESRIAEMPAFGRDQMLPRGDIEKIIAYVRSLSNQPDVRPDDVAAGKELFAANCASCHGETGEGSTDMGAPNLTDANWIYGGDAETVFETVWNGRHGHMPTWENRLSETERKILALYLFDLRQKKP